MTLVRADLEKGLEADECYWFSNSGAVRGKREIDLSIDPPPDLAIEVEISSPSAMKMRIYQALGVPEVWRYRGRNLTVLRLRGKKYVEVTRSSVLPRLRVAEVARFLERRDEVSETALVREFLEWARTTRTR